ncbi:hypothetical protein KFE25_008443 [Diacronema lutheri]|uniref:Uncharacterized protein n=1 Tax=Diacronema lutheri TaxID=2081491 RepID=A0A8J6C4V8_DIALT|nr:hypothetical protein KFE25_008443 [Diacronema lutheri]|mmetsp:Transcript_13217/g.41467  ORF Transcript_13217/g.41467 Transcript_13217/m.41467 type:complete len:97 (-) Transcript_13217:149-439(-)
MSADDKKEGQGLLGKISDAKDTLVSQVASVAGMGENNHEKALDKALDEAEAAKERATQAIKESAAKEQAVRAIDEGAEKAKSKGSEQFDTHEMVGK